MYEPYISSRALEGRQILNKAKTHLLQIIQLAFSDHLSKESNLRLKKLADRATEQVPALSSIPKLCPLSRLSLCYGQLTVLHNTSLLGDDYLQPSETLLIDIFLPVFLGIGLK